METKLRSQQWFGKTGKDGFIYRAWMRNQGLPVNPFERGYTRLFVTHVEQAHLGVDFDFLKGSSGSKVTRDSH